MVADFDSHRSYQGQSQDAEGMVMRRGLAATWSSASRRTYCPPELADRLGGSDALRTSGVFAQVEEH